MGILIKLVVIKLYFLTQSLGSSDLKLFSIFITSYQRWGLQKTYIIIKIRSEVIWVHLTYQIAHNQILNNKLQSHFPIMKNTLGLNPGELDLWAYFFFYWQVALWFSVQNLIVRDSVHEMNSGYRGSYSPK